MHIRLEVTLTGNNNNNEYLERLTHTGPKRLHILYKYILSTFNTYNMNAHTCTHTYRTGGNLLLTLCTSGLNCKSHSWEGICAHQTGSQEGIYYSLCAHQTGSQRRAFIIHFVHIRLEVTLTGNNNNNEYLEHLTHTGPKRLHILYKYILSTFNTYNMNAHTCTHTYRTGGNLLLTLCTSGWNWKSHSQEGIYYSLCAHQTGSHRRAFITHFVHIRLEVIGGHLLLTLCTSDWKS